MNGFLQNEKIMELKRENFKKFKVNFLKFCVIFPKKNIIGKKFLNLKKNSRQKQKIF